MDKKKNPIFFQNNFYFNFIIKIKNRFVTINKFKNKSFLVKYEY